MAYINGHQLEDAPPAIIRELISPSLILPESMDIAGQKVVLHLSETGMPESIPDVSTDGHPIEPGIISLLEKTCFYPALDKGTPVASRFELALETIFQ